MAEEEDDYMSDAVLNACAGQDVRPGMGRTTADRRRLEVWKRQEEQKEAMKKGSKAMREQEAREEGLNKALPEDNKGFALLAKMGYKPGMALGKSGEGRKEPIAVEIKTSREGLGEATERKERLQRRLQWEMNRKKRTVEEYASHIRNKFTTKRDESDVRRLQKACLDLDSKEGLDEPMFSHFWPPAALQKPLVDEDDVDKEEEDEEEEDLPPISEQLEGLIHYVRTRYHYCAYCGCKYDTEEDMRDSCPGASRDAHEQDEGQDDDENDVS